jgi:predicted component of type VI protein secretion system
MDSSNANASDGNKQKPDDTSQVSGLLRPKANRQSTTSIKDLLRNFVKGEESHPIPNKVPETTVEVSSQESGGTRAKVSSLHRYKGSIA